MENNLTDILTTEIAAIEKLQDALKEAIVYAQIAKWANRLVLVTIIAAYFIEVPYWLFLVFMCMFVREAAVWYITQIKVANRSE